MRFIAQAVISVIVSVSFAAPVAAVGQFEPAKISNKQSIKSVQLIDRTLAPLKRALTNSKTTQKTAKPEHPAVNASAPPAKTLKAKETSNTALSPTVIKPVAFKPAKLSKPLAVAAKPIQIDAAAPVAGVKTVSLSSFLGITLFRRSLLRRLISRFKSPTYYLDAFNGSKGVGIV